MERNEEAPATTEIQTQGGVWGKRSRKEIIAAATLVCVTVVALVVVIAVLATGDDDGYGSGSTPFERPVETAKLIATEQDELNLLHGVLQEYAATKPLSQNIPQSVSDLQDKDQDTEAAPEIRAAAWLIHQDEVINDENHLQRRFALAYIYYNNGGENWNRKTNWLSDKSHCEWEGVNCAGHERNLAHVQAAKLPTEAVYELELMGNNLTGNMPPTLILLRGLSTLFLQKNKLEGPLEDVGFRSLPNLLKVYLQHNLFTGDIPDTLAENGVVDTMFLQGNRFAGTFPQNYCKTCSNCQDAAFRHFGIDCAEVDCSNSCCSIVANCFYPRDDADDVTKDL